MFDMSACDGIQRFSSRDQYLVPRCLQEKQRGISAMFLSLPVKAELGGKVLLFLRDASGLYMHSGGREGMVGTFYDWRGSLTRVNLNEFHMQPDSCSNLPGFQPNYSSELPNFRIRFPCCGCSGLI